MVYEDMPLSSVTTPTISTPSKDIAGVVQSQLNRGCIYLSDAAEINSQVLWKFDAFIFDIDGVLILGEEVIEGAPETVRKLFEIGKKLFLLTNNSFITPRELVERLSNKGFPGFDIQNTYTTSSAVASYLRRIKYRGKVYLIGNAAMYMELSKVEGVEIIQSDHNTGRGITPYEFTQTEVDMSIGAVVMGFDTNINYYKIAYAHRILTENTNSLFLVTNRDKELPTKGHRAPGAGTFISALEFCTGRTAITVGKPSPFIIDEILSNEALSRDRICMVGDNLKTDIPFATKNGIGAIMVETGVGRIEDARSLERADRPDYVVPSLKNFLVA